jgi:murein DD-endopeptidase MepM/ murein hydrolase activator NlpD
MPRTHRLLRASAPCLALPRPLLGAARLLLLSLLVFAGLLPATPALAAPDGTRPQLWLPTPPGETWRILQGYACGSHNSWDRYSLDLAAAEGRTYDAPVRAAADGEAFVWVSKSGTLILSHGSGLYTMYTHMAAANVGVGQRVARGDVIGRVGDRGSPGTPHLHFTAFTAEGAWARNRQSTPLAFAEGYSLPEVGGCNQHGGTKLTAGGQAAPPADTVPPSVAPLPDALRAPAATPVPLSWPAGSDDVSGVAGYRIYLGADPEGTSDWFVPTPETQTPPLTPGSYLLRLQPIDNAGNTGAWTTVGTVVVE